MEFGCEPSPRSAERLAQSRQALSTEPNCEGTTFSHTLRYTLFDTPSVLSNEGIHLRFAYLSTRSVFDVWWVAVNGDLISTGLLPGRFGIHVHLSCPLPPRNPANGVKILFDGIIAALQENSIVPADDVVLRLSRKHGIDAELLRNRIGRSIYPFYKGTIQPATCNERGTFRVPPTFDFQRNGDRSVPM